MSKVQMLRAVVDQRLTAAAEEIFVLFERSIAEYEEELSRSKEENERQRKLLDAVFNPQLQLHRADVQQLLESKEEVPTEQQERSSSLDQEDPEPPHIKEEQEELWTSQEGEQLQGLEEADITTFTLTLVPMTSEDDEEKPQSSQLHQRQTEQMKTEADGEDCGGSEPARSSDPDGHLQSDDNNKMSDSSETDISDETPKNKEVPVSDKKYNSGEISTTCSECGKTFCSKSNLNKHKKIHTGEKPFSCSFCSKRFLQRGQLNTHITVHTGEKPFSCSVCKESFRLRRGVVKHMKIHTGEKPVSGKKGNTYDNIDRKSEPTGNVTLDLNTLKHNEVPASDTGKNPLSCYKCGKRFHRKDGLRRHMRVHTGEKPFSCTVCQKQFASKEAAMTHMRLHSGERPFGCSICGKRFNQKVCLQIHMKTHTGEKPFSCTLCGKRFTLKRGLADHMAVHMKEKRFTCTACDKRFTWLYQLRNHQAVCDPVKFHQNQTEKKFSCSECGKRFSRRYSLKLHIRIHTQEKHY
ncbi:gastrula zinc finger protein XlCGF57.1-like isoform X4 [Thunnus albacares]|uniref:gastrula zinc finger protein XlCGF57.1-like isoform X4 n=1 Tax=Thunnus albacares TaxID=8236 RepID=UPI001CF6E3D0|nr:gastrula zinc finger protein XlCGF57.1-like isoform X4 [Thunnus albacares]